MNVPAIVSFRPFVPAKDFDLSKRFYQALGFAIVREWPGGAELALGSSAFILTDFYVKDYAANFMMQLVVPDVDAWWEFIAAADLVGQFGVRPPAEPAEQPWGLVVAFVFDPSGILWHITTG